MGLAPSTAGGPSPPPPLHPRTPPPTRLGRSVPEHCKKSQGGWGEEGGRGRRREGLWLEGRVLQLQWGMGGPSKHQLGPERIFRGFLFLGRRIFSRIFSPDFFSSFLWEKVPEKSSRKIPGKILQNLYNKNPPTHFCRLAGTKLLHAVFLFLFGGIIFQ